MTDPSEPKHAPATISTASATTTTNQPLLLLHDEQRRRRKKKKPSPLPSSPQQPHHLDHINIQHNTSSSADEQHLHKPRSQSHKNRQYSSAHNLDTNPSRQHSKSGPPHHKHKHQHRKKKKRTFKLYEPKELSNKSNKRSSTHSHKVHSKPLRQSPTISTSYTDDGTSHTHSSHPHHMLKKKASRVFIHERTITGDDLNNPNTTEEDYSNSSPISSSLSSVPSFSVSRSAPSPVSQEHTPIYALNQPQQHMQASHIPRRASHSKQNSFKLGDDAVLPFKLAATSFSSYKTKYNVHKPNIKPGSNQFLVSQKMRQLQAKLLAEQEQKEMDSSILRDVEQAFGKPLVTLKSIKLPKYASKIPVVLIRLKKKLYAVDGLKQEAVFGMDLMDNTQNSAAHRIAALIRDFFWQLPERKLLDAMPVACLGRIVHVSQIADIVGKVVEPNRSILVWLWDLLADVMEYSEQNKMDVNVVARAVAPSMMINTDVSQLLVIFFKFGIEWRLHLRNGK